MAYTVYILRSGKDGGYYGGLTGDIDRRLTYHNRGYVRSTKSRRPFTIVHQESFATRPEARVREKFLKSYKGAKEKMCLIEKYTE